MAHSALGGDGPHPPLWDGGLSGGGLGIRAIAPLAKDLEDAGLEEASLWDADLWAANLTRAKVTTTQLAQAESLSGAIMPDGAKHG